jgi:hypothetical protein
MAPTNTGEITEHRWKDGTTITFGARVRAYGRRYRLIFGRRATVSPGRRSKTWGGAWATSLRGSADISCLR